MYIILHRKFFFWLTGLILAAAIGAILVFGLPLGIDFTGGSLMQVEYPNGRPALADIQKQTELVPVGAVSVRAFGENAISIRTRTMNPAEHEAMLLAVSGNESTIELAYTSVGPALGSQFTNKALTVALALLALIYFGAEATRNFALVMLVGVVAGTFSSITRSAPLLIPIANWFNKK